MMEIIRAADPKDGARKAALRLHDLLRLHAHTAVLLLFSGGSPLEILPFLPPEDFTGDVTVGVSDERYSDDPNINNFAQVQSRVRFKASIDTRSFAGETLRQCADRFDDALKDWHARHTDGKIIITQGIGLDGHTTGMMPYPESERFFHDTFVETSRWAVGYDAGEKNKYPQRITTTVPFLRMVDCSIVYVCGPDKQKPLSDVFSTTESAHVVPGRIIHQMRRVLLVTDIKIPEITG